METRTEVTYLDARRRPVAPRDSVTYVRQVRSEDGKLLSEEWGLTGGQPIEVATPDGEQQD